MLHEYWDPLGVASEPGAQGEYENYVPEIVRLLLRDAPAAEIAAYLTIIARERMGLAGDADHDARVAARLVALRKGTPCVGF